MSNTPENLQAYLDGQAAWSPQLESTFGMCCYLLSDADLAELIGQLVELKTPGFVAKSSLQSRVGREQSGETNVVDSFFRMDM